MNFLKRFQAPNTYIIISTILLIVGLLTWIVPGGEFQRQEVTFEDSGMTKEIVVPESFQKIENKPQGLLILTAPFRGFVDAADIVAFILIVGGAFSIFQRTKAVDAVIHNIARAQENNPALRRLTIPIFMIIFSLGGATFGMSEETIPFVLIFIPLAYSLGYDGITGVAIPYIGAHVGFAAAFLNPFTLGIAQGIAELPYSSGLGFRVFCWAVLTGAAIVVVSRHAERVKKDPKLSPTYELDVERRKTMGLDLSDDNNKLTGQHKLILTAFGLGMAVMVFGVVKFGWYIAEIAAVFLVTGIVVGLIARMRGDDIIGAFIDGSKMLIGTAMVIGLSRGIVLVAQDGKILDTILFWLASGVQDVHPTISAQVMFYVQSGLNFFVPSGSGQAALTMPILAPLGDLIGVSRQTTVLAYQFGDGFSNMIWPTAPVLLGALSLANIPWDRWIRWAWKAQLVFLILGMLLLIPAVLMDW